MAKYSQKVQGKEVGAAEVYAGPHDMSGKATNVSTYQKVETGTEASNNMNISVAGISKGNYKGINPYGTGTMRGYGAATKGRKISGKMG